MTLEKNLQVLSIIVVLTLFKTKKTFLTCSMCSCSIFQKQCCPWKSQERVATQRWTLNYPFFEGAVCVLRIGVQSQISEKSLMGCECSLDFFILPTSFYRYLMLLFNVKMTVRLPRKLSVCLCLRSGTSSIQLRCCKYCNLRWVEELSIFCIL